MKKDSEQFRLATAYLAAFSGAGSEALLDLKRRFQLRRLVNYDNAFVTTAFSARREVIDFIEAQIALALNLDKPAPDNPNEGEDEDA